MNKEYIKLNEDVIQDTFTRLIWQQSGSPDFLTFKEAEDYIKKLNKNKYAGFNNWRLPSLKEVLSIVKEEKNKEGLYIDDIFDSKQYWIWTSEKQSSVGAWVVTFHVKFLEATRVWGDLSYVRAVR